MLRAPSTHNHAPSTSEDEDWFPGQGSFYHFFLVSGIRAMESQHGLPSRTKGKQQEYMQSLHPLHSLLGDLPTAGAFSAYAWVWAAHICKHIGRFTSAFGGGGSG